MGEKFNAANLGTRSRWDFNTYKNFGGTHDFSCYKFKCYKYGEKVYVNRDCKMT